MNYKLSLVIVRCVNAYAFPESPKPLNNGEPARPVACHGSPLFRALAKAWRTH
jgi:hypothetical protein